MRPPAIECAIRPPGYLVLVVHRDAWRGIQSQGTGGAVNLVSKLRDSAGGLYEQAKARFTASDTMQKAGYKTGWAGGQLASQLSDAAGKASGAVRAARAARLAQRHPADR